MIRAEASGVRVFIIGTVCDIDGCLAQLTPVQARSLAEDLIRGAVKCEATARAQDALRQAPGGCTIDCGECPRSSGCQSRCMKAHDMRQGQLAADPFNRSEG